MSALQLAPPKNGGMQTTHMAGGGFTFLLLTFQYLVGWGIINLVIGINLFRFVYFENIQRGSLVAIR
jgi:hypothetical protein